MRCFVSKIVSGGQTGADRAALDFALRKGIPHGGWVPKGRAAEDGPLPRRYRMRETASTDYPERTERNILDSDATLIFTQGPMRGGTLLTWRLARRSGKPVRVVRTGRSEPSPGVLRRWLARHRVKTLNIAGPRASKEPRIHGQVLSYLEELLA